MSGEVIIAIVSMLLMPAIMFAALKYMPSRREFEMHLKQDDERFGDVKASLNRIEINLIGVLRANKREHP